MPINEADLSKHPKGLLPLGWRWVTVAELAAPEPNSITDGPFGSKLKTEHYTDSGPRVIRLQNIGDAVFVDARAHISNEHFETLRKHRVFGGDLVIAALGENPPRACIIPDSVGPAIVKADCIRLKVCPGVSAKFVNYALNSDATRRRTKGIVHGVGRPRLNLSEIKSIAIPLPPLDEQQRIVAEIEKQLTRLAAGVASLKRVQVALKRYRASVLKAACEGRLVPTEAELARRESRNYEPAPVLLSRTLKERRSRTSKSRRYVEPNGPNVGMPNTLPEGWTWATFEQVSERVTVGFVGSMKQEYVEVGVPFLRSQNVRENRFDWNGLLYISPAFHNKLSKSALRPGDLAVVRSGSVGVTCVIPEVLSEANCSDLVLIQRPIGFVPQYGAYYMNSLARRHVEAGKVGVALTHFNTKSVASLPIPLPPLAEQQRIVSEVERRLSLVAELEALVVRNLHRATCLRQAILKHAFSGGLIS